MLIYYKKLYMKNAYDFSKTGNKKKRINLNLQNKINT